MSKKDRSYITAPLSSGQRANPQRKRFRLWTFIFFVLAFLIFAFLLVGEFSKNDETTPNKNTDSKNYNTPEPQFKKEGELVLLRADKKDTIKKLDIEIADNDAERTQGLMYRKNMPETQGMLFIFPKPEMHTFWMKNTVMSLDIIYIGADRKIVSIGKYAKPFSEETIPSGKEAQYVLEVNAGFADKYKLAAGDAVDFVKK
jgi:uncharacterized protein